MALRVAKLPSTRQTVEEEKEVRDVEPIPAIKAPFQAEESRRVA
jgi:hypothetical protein